MALQAGGRSRKCLTSEHTCVRIFRRWGSPTHRRRKSLEELALDFQESYEHALGGLRRELRIGRVLAHLTYHRPRLRRWIFRKSGQTLSDVMTDVMLGDRTYAGIVRRATPYALRRAIGGR